jgi:hypothetical protein
VKWTFFFSCFFFLSFFVSFFFTIITAHGMRWLFIVEVIIILNCYSWPANNIVTSKTWIMFWFTNIYLIPIVLLVCYIWISSLFYLRETNISQLNQYSDEITLHLNLYYYLKYLFNREVS